MPASALPVSASAFDQLDPRIIQAIQKKGYTTPTDIQSQSIELILQGGDVVASSPTGTGKTAAFVLPALHHLSLKTESSKKPRVLILSPTRELATQISDAIRQYSLFLRIHTVSLVGGAPYFEQTRALERGVEIVIATPGRLWDHFQAGRLDLSKIEMFILDEADRMLDMGFIDDIQQISQKIPKRRQTILFSATIAQRLSVVIEELLKNPSRVNLTQDTAPPAKITQHIFFADNPDHKKALFQAYLEKEAIFKGIVFSATKMGADHLCRDLTEWGFRATPIHGDLNQKKRSRAIEQLRRGKVQFLVATDVASRGIDVQEISHVINYDLPKFSEDYVHRVGRTGRAGKTGIAVSFALHSDLRSLMGIERFTKQKIEEATIPGMEPKKLFRNDKRAFPPKKGGASDSAGYRGRGRTGHSDQNREPSRGFKKWGPPSDRSERPARSEYSARSEHSTTRYSERPARSEYPARPERHEPRAAIGQVKNFHTKKRLSAPHHSETSSSYGSSSAAPARPRQTDQRGGYGGGANRPYNAEQRPRYDGDRPRYDADRPRVEGAASKPFRGPKKPHHAGGKTMGSSPSSSYPPSSGAPRSFKSHGKPNGSSRSGAGGHHYGNGNGNSSGNFSRKKRED